MTFDYDISFLWIYTISGNPKNLLMHDTQNHYRYLSRHLNIMINTISNCGSQIDTTVKQLPKICPQNKARVCTKNSFTINNTSTSSSSPQDFWSHSRFSLISTNSYIFGFLIAFILVIKEIFLKLIG